LPDWIRLDSVSPADRPDAWQGLLRESYTHVALTERLPNAFGAMLRRRAIGDLSIAECICDPHSGARLPQLVRDESEPCIGLQLVLGGRESFRLDDNEVTLGPGDAVLWSSRQAFDYTVHETLHKLTLIVPIREFGTRVKPEALERGRLVRGDDGVGALLFSLISTLGQKFGPADDATIPAVRRAVIELLVALLADDTERAQPRARSERHLARVQDYIHDHLSDAELRLCDIAANTGISLRYLHLLFERSGTSVSAWILDARLERCREALMDPGQAARSVTEIAFAWGFNNTAYFSRVFKRRFGDCPSNCRGAVRDQLA
jgi:AraC-like DNA-binding protein